MSKLLRRSGIAVYNIGELLGWRPDCCYHIGIGLEFREVEVMSEGWPGISYWGCEPMPAAAELARQRYPGAVYEVAITNEANKKVPIYWRKRHANGASLCAPRETLTELSSAMVKTQTIDTLFGKPAGKHALLWLDCEGSELAAMEGGTEFIKDVEVINVETTADGERLGAGWADQVAIHHKLIEMGFYRQWIHTQRNHVGQVDVIYVRPHLFEPKIGCCPCDVERFRGGK